MSEADPPRVLIAAGGTAGHVVPALAIADALLAEGAHVEFAGGERAEAELVPAHGFAFHPLAVAGLSRKNPFKAIKAAWLALRAVRHARALIADMRADVVVGGGGYVAGPVGLAASRSGVPLFLTEADSHLGVSNRWLAKRAEKVFLSFPIEGREDARYEVVGRPMPADVGMVDREASRHRFGIAPDARCLLIFGGSLGARSLNDAAFEAFAKETAFTVLHVAGRRDYPELRKRLDELGSPAHYRLEEYVEPFAQAYAAADLAAARAGGSVAELAAAGLPAILVPYPHATGDHQRRNAEWMAKAGAAIVIPDEQLDGQRLAVAAEALLGDAQLLAQMSRAARAIAKPQAAQRIAAEVLAAAARKAGT